MSARRIQLLAVAVIAAGLFFTKPSAALASSGSRMGDCVGCACCWDQCPANLNTFCHDQACSSQGATCSLLECEWEGGYMDYDIECGAIS
jgi:hypothetical protein